MVYEVKMRTLLLFPVIGYYNQGFQIRGDRLKVIYCFVVVLVPKSCPTLLRLHGL